MRCKADAVHYEALHVGAGATSTGHVRTRVSKPGRACVRLPKGSIPRRGIGGDVWGSPVSPRTGKQLEISKVTHFVCDCLVVANSSKKNHDQCRRRDPAKDKDGILLCDAIMAPAKSKSEARKRCSRACDMYAHSSACLPGPAPVSFPLTIQVQTAQRTLRRPPTLWQVLRTQSPGPLSLRRRPWRPQAAASLHVERQEPRFRHASCRR